MRIALWIGIAALAALTACRTVETTPATLDASQVATVQAAVTRSLKDPDSARFGDIKAGLMPNGGYLVCGYVNARNSFGGYTGDSPYVGVLSGTAFELRGLESDWGASPSHAVALVANCRANGVPI